METRFVPVDEEVRETRREPAKRWRNKWRAVENVTYSNGTTRREGDVFWGGRGPFPNYDIAETDALKVRSEQEALGWAADEWLGAFPVEDT